MLQIISDGLDGGYWMMAHSVVICIGAMYVRYVVMYCSYWIDLQDPRNLLRILLVLPALLSLLGHRYVICGPVVVWGLHYPFMIHRGLGSYLPIGR